MKLIDYMTNPMGKGSSTLMLPVLRKELDEQYSKIYHKITASWYVFQKKFYIAHVKIPSLSVDKLFYDVLIEIDIETIPSSTSVINMGNAKFFSNCPSFTFTYAYVFNKNNDIISWAKKKYPIEIFALEPKVRNPQQIRSYERSLYFAIKYLTTNGRNYKNKVNYKIHEIENYVNLLKTIRSSDEILELYKSGKKRHESKKPEVKKKETPHKAPSPGRNKNKTPSTKKVSSVKKTKKSNKTKSVKHI